MLCKHMSDSKPVREPLAEVIAQALLRAEIGLLLEALASKLQREALGRQASQGRGRGLL